MVYRQDLFAKLGYPDLPGTVETWDDFLQVAREVTRSKVVDPENPRYAIGLHIKDFWEFWQMLLQRGGGFTTRSAGW